jgi:hypothetical protein
MAINRLHGTGTLRGCHQIDSILWGHSDDIDQTSIYSRRYLQRSRYSL